VKRVSSTTRTTRANFLLIGSATALSALAFDQKLVQAQTTTLPPTASGIEFQTSSPGRCANIGDWYTTNGSSSNTPGNTADLTPPQLCLPTDPSPTTNPLTNRFHRFLIDVSPALAATGTTITVRGAGSGGSEDAETDGLTTGASPLNPDPTRFTLFAPDGSQIGAPQVFNGAGDAVFNIPAGSPPGGYTVRSEAGQQYINPGTFVPELNDDDNNFSIEVTGGTELLIGFFQGTFQNRAVGSSPNVDFFFLAGPQTGAVDILNFDLDGDGALSYFSPAAPGTAILGTVGAAGAPNWQNGGLNNRTASGNDTQTVGTGNAGRWRINLAGYGNGFVNQSILEVVARDRNQPLPVFTTPPTSAGNFTITSDTTLRTQVGQKVCHGFVVTNNFLTSDIVNLTRTGTDPNYTTEYFADAAGTIPLPDTDGDGNPDTGILAANGGQSPTLYLCATPRNGAPPQDTTRVVGTSFMDRRVREQSFPVGDTRREPTPQFVTKITLIGEATATPSSFRIVKRITNIVRNGTTLPGENYGTVINDPNDTNDDATGFTQLPLAGILAQPVSNPVRSNDEVTYTVYFLSDGGSPTIDANICDLIPGGMTFIPGSLEVKRANDPVGAGGNFFTPLAPLPENNSCTIQENPNGAAIYELGTVSNNPGSNFGFVRFRVRVN
jgi:uncharacterized repeat protein (TIGR01451 family)